MKAYHTILLILLISIFAFLSVTSALNESLTFDEKTDVEVGLRAWREHILNIEPYNPVFIRMITTIPLVLGADHLVPSDKTAIRYFPARAVSILFGVGVLIMTYIFTKKYFNRDAALLAVFFIAFEPNLLANSHYITQDTGAVFFFMLAFFTLVNYFIRPTAKNVFIASLSVGLAFASKLTLIPYLSATGLFMILYLRREKTFHWLRVKYRQLLMALVIIFMTVWAIYFFQSDVIIAPDLRDGRVSQKIVKNAEETGNTFIITGIEFLKTQKIPLGSYMALIKNSLLRSQLPQQTFFLGNIYDGTKWYFIDVNFLLKVPLMLLLLTILGILQDSVKQNVGKKMLIYIPIITVLGMASLLNMKPFIRYVLPVFPFLAISSAYALLNVKIKTFIIIFILILSLTLFRQLTFFPHFITYANIFTGQRQNSYKFLYDSNIDWGQSLPDLRTYLNRGQFLNIDLSYFGTDDPEEYGINLQIPFRHDTFEQICAFRLLDNPARGRNNISIISITNWYECGYFTKDQFSVSKINSIVGNTFLVFREK